MSKLPALLLFLLVACNSGDIKVARQQIQTEAKKESKYKELLAKFKEKSFDTLKVYSPEELEGEYKGVELTDKEALLFPEEIAEQHFNDPPGLFAVYKIQIDENRSGLLARTPSMYVPSSLKFFIYDIKQDSIIAYKEIAETWGDAGDYINLDSWLFREGKQLRAFSWFFEGHDNSVEDESDSTKTETHSFTLTDLTKPTFDTLSADSAALVRQFGHLIKPKW